MMKGIKNRPLKFGLVLMGIGLAVFAGNMTALGWDFGRFGTGECETNSFTIKEDFTSISIETEDDDISFARSQDGSCRVEVCELENVRHNAEVKNGTLTITSEDTRKWYEHISLFSFADTSVKVYLPNDSYDLLKVSGSTGDTEIPGGFTFKEISVNISTGDVVCSADSQGSLTIETSTGSISVKDNTSGSMTLSASTGDIGINSAVCKGSAALTMSTGSTSIDGFTCESLDSKGSTGDLTMKGVIVSGRLFAERSTGDVTLDGCDAGEIIIETDTGDITGTLLSEKIFFAESDTGSIDVPKTTTGGKCELKTDTGEISMVIGS